MIFEAIEAGGGTERSSLCLLKAVQNALNTIRPFRYVLGEDR